MKFVIYDNEKSRRNNSSDKLLFMAKYNAMQRTEEANHGKAQGKSLAAAIYDGNDIPFSHWKPHQ